MTDGRALTIREVAVRVGVSEATVRRLIARGDIRSFRVGTRLVRVLEVEVERYLDRRDHHPPRYDGTGSA